MLCCNPPSNPLRSSTAGAPDPHTPLPVVQYIQYLCKFPIKLSHWSCADICKNACIVAHSPPSTTVILPHLAPPRHFFRTPLCYDCTQPYTLPAVSPRITRHRACLPLRVQGHVALQFPFCSVVVLHIIHVLTKSYHTSDPIRSHASRAVSSKAPETSPSSSHSNSSSDMPFKRNS